MEGARGQVRVVVVFSLAVLRKDTVISLRTSAASDVHGVICGQLCLWPRQVLLCCRMRLLPGPDERAQPAIAGCTRSKRDEKKAADITLCARSMRPARASPPEGKLHCSHLSLQNASRLQRGIGINENGAFAMSGCCCRCHPSLGWTEPGASGSPVIPKSFKQVKGR